MNYTEEAAVFACEGQRLIGIVARPETPKDIGVVVIVGGPQYRAGSHRQFVLLSRALAEAGFAVLRFDYRGMGDGDGDQRDFESVSADVASAIDVLQSRVPAVKQVALWGLCDGASAALLYCHETGDPRVAGLCLLNPWVRSEASFARTRVKHYYCQRLMQWAFWSKLFTGKVAVNAIAGLIVNVKAILSKPHPSQKEKSTQQFQYQMATAWDKFKGNILLILSGDDYTAKEFLEYVSRGIAWENALIHPQMTRYDLPNADHTFSNRETSQKVNELTCKWLDTGAFSNLQHALLCRVTE